MWHSTSMKPPNCEHDESHFSWSCCYKSLFQFQCGLFDFKMALCLKHLHKCIFQASSNNRYQLPSTTIQVANLWESAWRTWCEMCSQNNLGFDMYQHIYIYICTYDTSDKFTPFASNLILEVVTPWVLPIQPPPCSLCHQEVLGVCNRW